MTGGKTSSWSTKYVSMYTCGGCYEDIEGRHVEVDEIVYHPHCAPEVRTYTVVWLMGYDDGNGRVCQAHVYAHNPDEARSTFEADQFKSCAGRVLSVLRGHL